VWTFQLVGFLMDQKVLKIEDLNPDGIRIVVNWDELKVSGSVFIPCVDTEKTKDQVSTVASLRQWEVKHEVRVENRTLGLRVWRTL